MAMKMSKRKMYGLEAKAFRHRFPMRRVARMNRMCVKNNISKGKIAAAKNLKGPQIKIRAQEPWTNTVTKAFETNGLKVTEVSGDWVLKKRKDVARDTAMLMANRVFSTTENLLESAEKLRESQKLDEVYNPARPTVVVVVDMDKEFGACKKIGKKIMPLEREVPGLCQFGQYVVWSNEKNSNPKYGVVPILLTPFECVVDRPQNYKRVTHANMRAAYNNFADREGIYTATVQMLDEMLEDNRALTGVDYKLIFTYRQVDASLPGLENIDMSELCDVVHCEHSELDTAIKSRVYATKMN